MCVCVYDMQLMCATYATCTCLSVSVCICACGCQKHADRQTGSHVYIRNKQADTKINVDNALTITVTHWGKVNMHNSWVTSYCATSQAKTLTHKLMLK